MNDKITKSFLKKLSKQAKEIAKSSDQTYMQALDIVAKSSGFSSYHEVQTIYKRQLHQSSATQDNIDYFDQVFLPFLQKILSEPKIKKDIKEAIYNKKRFYSKPMDYFDEILIKQVNEGLIDKSTPHVKEALDRDIIRIQKFNNIVTLEQSEKKINTLLVNGIFPGGEFTKSDWYLINEGIDKEWIKEFGYKFIHSSEIDNIFGHHCIALGHFLRSAAACFIDRREYHPNFKVYMADWISAIGICDETDIKLLKIIYPQNKTSGLPKGVSYWKEQNLK